MNGLLDFIKTPEGQGLLSAAFGGLAGAQRGAPLNSVGRAGMSGLMGYGNALERQDLVSQNAQAKQLRDMQIAKARAELDDEALDRRTAAQFYTPGKPAVGALDSALPAQFQTGAVPMPAVPASFDLPGYAQARLGQNPRAGIALMQQIQKDAPFNKLDPKDYTPDSVKAFSAAGGRDYSLLQPRVKSEIAPNGMVYNPYAVQPGTVFSDPNKPFSVTAQGASAPNLPFQQFEINRAAAGAARNSNTVIAKQEGEEAKKVGGFFGENYSDIQKAGMNAQGTLNRMDRLGQLLDGVNTGKFAPLGVEVAKGAEALGFRVDPNLSNKEAAIALSGEMALQLRNPSGGAGMPGAMSDADRQFLANMVPGIEKTPEGRQLILETGRKLAQRDVEVARMAREYRKKRGSIDEGFYDELAVFSAAKPLFQAAPRPGPRVPPAPPAAAPRFLGFE